MDKLPTSTGDRRIYEPSTVCQYVTQIREINPGRPLETNTESTMETIVFQNSHMFQLLKRLTDCWRPGNMLVQISFVTTEHLLTITSISNFPSSYILLLPPTHQLGCHDIQSKLICSFNNLLAPHSPEFQANIGWAKWISHMWQWTSRKKSTLPETNSKRPWKVWRFLLETTIFRWYVSFRGHDFKLKHVLEFGTLVVQSWPSVWL